MPLGNCYEVRADLSHIPKWIPTSETYSGSLDLNVLIIDQNIHSGTSRQTRFGKYLTLPQILHESHGDVRKGDLIHHNVSGGFPENIARTLQNDSKLALEIIQRLLSAHFPSTLHEDILAAVGIEYPLRVAEIESSRLVSKRKGRDPNFRLSILRAYEYKCAICSFDVRLGNTLVALEAAHIRWQQAGGPDELANGLALCSLHHKLFDRGAFTLSNQLKILVSDDANGSVGFEEWLLRFHGTRISFPQKRSYYPQGNFIGWHVKEVFKGDYREL